MFHRFLPTFEKPVTRPRHMHIEEESREFSGVAVVLLIAASCGVGLALWEPSQQITSPFVTASAPAPAAPGAAPTSAKMPEPETTANAAETATSADADDDQTPTVKLTPLGAPRATARRDCANAKAFRETRLNAPEPAAAQPAASELVGSIGSQPAAKESAPAKNAAPTKTVATAKETTPPAKETATATAPKETATPPKETATAAKATAASPKETPRVREATTAAVPPEVTAAVAAMPVETPAAQPQRTAATPKARQRQRAADRDDDSPVERLTRVGERVMPDGRRVTVYRRSNGSYEIGSIVDGEYRPTRRTEAGARYFGLQ